MKKRLSIPALVIAGLLTLSALIGCSADTQAVAALAATTAQTAVTASAVTDTHTLPISDYDTEDLDDTVPADATAITLTGSGATVTGSGASVSGSTITLSKAGAYVVTGTLNAGQIVVDAGKEDLVHIILQGASVTNPTGPALYGIQSDKIVVTLAEGTVNYLADGSAYTLAEGEDEPNAALFSKDDLSINGKGALTVMGNYLHGILSKDDLIVADGTLNVTAVENGLRGRDSVSVKGGTLTVTAGNDGIQSNNDEAEDKGWVILDGGIITITAGDDGIHAETDLIVNDGALCVLDSEEGLEGKTVTLSGGTVDVKANDDGINATAGSTEAAAAPAAGEKPTGPMDGAQDGVYIRITGGQISVDASGDGIDSNGDIFISGGTVLVNGPTNNGNGPLDYNGTCTVTGGTLAFAGSSGMAQSPGTESSQASLTVLFTETQAAGTPVTLTDASGNVILSATPSKTYQSIVFSSSDLAVGKSYTLQTGGTLSGSETGLVTTTGTLSGAKTLTTVTLADTVTRINENGEAVTGGMMGPGGGKPGSRPPRPTDQTVTQ